ncbi:MAG: hypothetical protein B7Z03_04550 [Hydrogenophilales bacterium 32-62-9]|nr:MAG: hypothetical protein B7Z03_04550 [Hydrogenophilales bacterium 32-62-9]
MSDSFKVNSEFRKWALGFSGCDGGDIGTPEKSSVWFCGIEWGGGHPANTEELLSIWAEDVSAPSPGYKYWNTDLNYIFNWRAAKLLSAIDGGCVSAYKHFAERVQLFASGNCGYFKMNLYPLAFKNTSHTLWHDAFADATGFASKQDYLAWIRANRFPVLKSLGSTHAPKLVVCVGITYREDFKAAFVDDGVELNCEVIDGRDLYWAKNENESMVVIIPFMVNHNGLTKDVSIQKFGERIRSLTAAEPALG